MNNSRSFPLRYAVITIIFFDINKFFLIFISFDHGALSRFLKVK